MCNSPSCQENTFFLLVSWVLSPSKTKRVPISEADFSPFMLLSGASVGVSEDGHGKCFRSLMEEATDSLISGLAIFLFSHWFATHREAGSPGEEPSLLDVPLRTLFFVEYF